MPLDMKQLQGMMTGTQEGRVEALRQILLHGNSKKKEKQPNGLPDENVFDIQQGVNIALALKGVEKSVSHCHLYGNRNDKYNQLLIESLETTEWFSIEPESHFYLYIPQNKDLFNEYEKGYKLTEIMPVNSLGFQSHRDQFAVDIDQQSLYERINNLKEDSFTDEQLRSLYGLVDNRDWKLTNARRQIRNDLSWEKHFIRCSYRPFDRRFCYFNTVAMDYPRRELLAHVAHKKNICLNSVRQTKMDTWQHGIVSDSPAPAVFVEIKDGSNIFPLYLYDSDSNIQQTTLFNGTRVNFSSAFVADVASRIGYTPSPETIFYYIYAIFYCPSYRSRYLEFLKNDFPRIPLTSSSSLFEKLAELGEDITHYQRIVVALQETIRLMQQIDEAIPGFPLE